MFGVTGDADKRGRVNCGAAVSEPNHVNEDEKEE
jgi:hypothetical protein